jgi:putative transposase
MQNLQRKNVQHWNLSGHAHELTFSCNGGADYLKDSTACSILHQELEKARRIYSFKLLAYVFMPTHVHLLIVPTSPLYDITKILSGIKGVMSRKYRKHLQGTDMAKHDLFLVKKRDIVSFMFWQPGAGFDRNLWNPEAIHAAINYIEANPVRKNLSVSKEKWRWSSASAGGLVVDGRDASVLMVDE